MATGAEGLKNSSNRQGDILNRGGSASTNLENASKETVPGGGGAGTGSGNPTKDADGKSPSHKKPDDNKSLGESLEYLRQKTEMQKALELKWKRKEWEEFGRGKMIEESVIKLALDNFLGKGIFEPIGKAIGKTAAKEANREGESKIFVFPAWDNLVVDLADVEGSVRRVGAEAKAAFRVQYTL